MKHDTASKPVPRMSWSDIKRFWEKVEIPKSHNQCFIWKAGCIESGYGVIRIKGRSIKAHRVACTMYHGEIPKGLIACHTCDNRKCVNPLHLFIGTDDDNINDMCDKGRQRGGSGENHWTRKTPERMQTIRRGKLTESEIQVILKESQDANLSYREIARRAGISHCSVSKILRKI